MTSADRPPTPFAVNCPTHRMVYLTPAEYDHQMSRPDDLWVCPECGAPAIWNDANYERRIDAWWTRLHQEDPTA